MSIYYNGFSVHAYNHAMPKLSSLCLFAHILCSLGCLFLLCVVAGEDFLAIPPTAMVLNDHNYHQCFNVTMLDNRYLESKEIFTINITSYELLPSSANFELSAYINLEYPVTEITIEDDEGKL